MTFRMKAVSLLVAIGVTGCGTPYVAPTSGDTASLTIVNRAAVSANLMTFKTARQCVDRVVLPALPATQETKIRIPAPGQWIMSVNTVEGGLTCTVIGAFAPEKGANYRLEYKIGADGHSCGISLTDADSGQPIQMGLRRSRRPGWGEESWCY
jgi:hypothetical protein